MSFTWSECSFLLPPQSLCNTKLTSHVRCLLPEKRRAIKTHVSEKCYTSYICISPECRANSKAFMSPSDHKWHFWKNWKLHMPLSLWFRFFFTVWVVQPNFFFAVSCWGFEKKIWCWQEVSAKTFESLTGWLSKEEFEIFDAFENWFDGSEHWVSNLENARIFQS